MSHKDKAISQGSLQNEALPSAIANECEIITNLEKLSECLDQWTTEAPTALNIRKNITYMLSAHRNLRGELEKSCCTVSSAYLAFASHIHFYLDYCCYLKRIRSFSQRASSLTEEIPIDTERLFRMPIQHITRYEEVLSNFCKVLPESEGRVLNGICEVIQRTISEMRDICAATENALKVLWLQKCLIQGQPKIFVAGRVLLKEGTLLKVNSNGRSISKRELFLFNDILLCCKKRRCYSGVYKKSSLRCCAVIPLQSCSIRTILTSKFEGEDLFKLMWEDYVYVLFSQTVGVSQSWVKDIQLTIRQCKEATAMDFGITLPVKSCVLKRSAAIVRRPGLARETSEADISSSRLSASSINPSRNAFSAIKRFLRFQV